MLFRDAVAARSGTPYRKQPQEVPLEKIISVLETDSRLRRNQTTSNACYVICSCTDTKMMCAKDNKFYRNKKNSTLETVGESPLVYFKIRCPKCFGRNVSKTLKHFAGNLKVDEFSSWTTPFLQKGDTKISRTADNFDSISIPCGNRAVKRNIQSDLQSGNVN